jgi:Mg-chelatase subunit ChlD
VPFDWSYSTAHLGVALIVFADRRGDVEIARKAVSQLESALETLRNGGQTPFAAYVAEQLQRARAVLDKLSKL